MAAALAGKQLGLLKKIIIILFVHETVS